MSLSAAAIAEAATLLVAARREGRLLDGLPSAVAPETPDDAYAIQDRVRATWDDAVAGWKTGATAAAVQARFGTDQPFTGPFYARTVMKNPAVAPAAEHLHRAVECEFAFRFGRALDAETVNYARNEVLAAVDALVPAIEIVGPRFKAIPFGRVADAIADNGVNGAMVFGAPIADWRDVDLPSHAVRLTVDGITKAEGTGAAVLGDPIKSLVWTVNHLAGRGIRIAAGQILSTGTATGVVVVQPGEAVVADFGSLGQVMLTFTA